MTIFIWSCFNGGSRLYMPLLPYIYKQPNDWMCGPAVARIILHFFGQKKDIWDISRELGTNKAGTSNRDLKRLLKRYAIKYTEKRGLKINQLKKLSRKNWLVTVYWIPKHKEYHYSIIKNITSKRLYFHDTWYGLNHSYSVRHFLKNWRDGETDTTWTLVIKK